MHTLTGTTALTADQATWSGDYTPRLVIRWQRQPFIILSSPLGALGEKVPLWMRRDTWTHDCPHSPLGLKETGSRLAVLPAVGCNWFIEEEEEDRSCCPLCEELGQEEEELQTLIQFPQVQHGNTATAP